MNLEDLGKSLLIFFLPEELIHPGFGIILWIIVFLLTGIILKTTAIGHFLSRVPVIGIFFRRRGGTVITLKRLMNLTPCLFLYSPTCPSYGWILSEEKVKLNEETVHFGLINVYYPNVPSIVTGQIFPVRRETVIKLGNPSREIVDMLLYALRSPENIRYLPWEDENEDEFKKRAEDFGINLSTN
jgi:Na+/citrate or Na+/malate symporter